VFFFLVNSLEGINQRSSPDKASTRITKKRIWLLCNISILKGTQFFVIRPFLPIVQTLRNSRWTGRTQPRCLDGPARGLDVMHRQNLGLKNNAIIGAEISARDSNGRVLAVAQGFGGSGGATGGSSRKRLPNLRCSK
jgi:hypothetical protein